MQGPRKKIQITFDDISCQSLLPYTHTPVQEIKHPVVEAAGVRLLIKREDLNHPIVSGNKWWKLKYNLEAAKAGGSHTLLTFGGAYSNHIYATAGAANASGFKSIGIIRGERVLPLNPVLAFAESQGMQLHFVSREAYRKKTEKEFIRELQDRLGDFYLIPEGGSNDLAVNGVTEFARVLKAEIEFDHLICAVGTGGTLAGLINGMEGERNIIGVPVLKGGEFLAEMVKDFLPAPYTNWRLDTAYHFGGYGKMPLPLMTFIETFCRDAGIPLDPVYTGKLLYAVFDMLSKGSLKRGDTVVVLHSGGIIKN